MPTDYYKEWLDACAANYRLQQEIARKERQLVCTCQRYDMLIGTIRTTNPECPVHGWVK